MKKNIQILIPIFLLFLSSPIKAQIINSTNINLTMSNDFFIDDKKFELKHPRFGIEEAGEWNRIGSSINIDLESFLNSKISFGIRVGFLRRIFQSISYNNYEPFGVTETRNSENFIYLKYGFFARYTLKTKKNILLFNTIGTTRLNKVSSYEHPNFLLNKNYLRLYSEYGIIFMPKKSFRIGTLVNLSHYLSNEKDKIQNHMNSIGIHVLFQKFLKKNQHN